MEQGVLLVLVLVLEEEVGELLVLREKDVPVPYHQIHRHRHQTFRK